MYSIYESISAYAYIFCKSIIRAPGPWPGFEYIIWPTCEQRLPMHGLAYKVNEMHLNGSNQQRQSVKLAV